MTDQTGARTRMRILIIAHAFPPLNSTASHRPYSWARAWRDLGHAVHVLTAVKHGFDGTMDMARDLSGIDVHEVGYLPFVAKAPEVQGSGVSPLVNRWERMKSRTRQSRFSLAMFGDPRLFACRPLVRKGRRLMRDAAFDFIIATSPPEVTFVAARALSRSTGVPWVADFRDLWFHEMRLYHSRLASRLAGHVNRWLIKSAAVLVTVSEGLVQRLAAYVGRPVLLSYNGYFERNQEQEPVPARPGDGRIHIVYTGRVYPERQDPSPLFGAIRRLRQEVPDLAGRIAVDFYGFDEPWLRAKIEEFGVGDCVRLHGFIPHRQSIAAQRAADILLLLDWTDLRAEGVVTGKVFEYLASQRPILAVGSRKNSEAARIIADAGCGLALAQDEEIAKWLIPILQSGKVQPVDPRNIERYSRERQARALLAEVASRLGLNDLAQGLRNRSPK